MFYAVRELCTMVVSIRPSFIIVSSIGKSYCKPFIVVSSVGKSSCKAGALVPVRPLCLSTSHQKQNVLENLITPSDV